MPKIVVATLADTAVAEHPTRDPVWQGPVDAHPLIARDDASLHLHYYILGGGGTLRWTNPLTDACAFVVRGSVEINGVEIGAGGCFLVEHGAAATLLCEQGADIAIFEDRYPTVKKGGNVHIIKPEDVPNNANADHDDVGSSWILADSTCNSCDLWLHGNFMPEGNAVGLHHHDVDEIIVVTEGEIVLGNRRYGAVTAVAIAKGAIYAFKSGSGGLRMVNFRASTSTAKHVGVEKISDATEYFRTRLGKPRHLYLLSADGR